MATSGSRVTLALVVGMAAGCASQADQQTQQYQVRAEVSELTGEGEEARVSLHHEAIPSFKNRTGEVVGMESMTMAFGLGQSVDRASLRPGTKLSVTFEVNWQREPALLVLSVDPLPQATELKLR
jgi:Cu/Ag efflux protein CusF